MKSKSFFVVSIFGLFLLVLIIWVAYASYMCGSSCFNDWSGKGQFGDMFGGLNALFSGFAFAGLLYTLILQRKSVEYQFNEISFTIKSIKRQNSLQLKSARLQAISLLLEKELVGGSVNWDKVAEYQGIIEGILDELKMEDINE